MTDPLEGLKTDCRHFRWDRPCAPHKATGVTCSDTCPELEPVRARVLFVKLAAVGDVLRTTAMLPAIARRYGTTRVTWITEPQAAELFAGNPNVDEVLTTDDATLMARLSVEEFDAVYCPDADPRTAMLAAAARARARYGFAMDGRGRVVPGNAAAEHWLRMGIDDARKRANRQTYQALIAAALELEHESGDLPQLLPAAEHRALAAERWGTWGFDGPVVGINTGAGGRWARKRWTPDHQRTLVADLAARGVGVLLLGGPEEAGTHAQLIPKDAAAPVVSAGTDHGYRQFAALVERCDALVTGDTMALHVACARQVPVVALFGPTSVDEIELYGRGVKLAPEDLECLGCYLPTCDVSPHCQERIAPGRVRDAVLQLLAAR